MIYETLYGKVNISTKSGADPGFSNRGGAKDVCTLRARRGAKSLAVWVPVQGPFMALEALCRVLDALKCFPSLIWKRSYTKRDTKKIKMEYCRSNLEGRAPVAPPPGSATD